MIISDDSLIHNLDNNSAQAGPTSKGGLPYPKLFLFLVGMVVFGIAAGFFATKLKGLSNKPSQNEKVAQTAGIADKKTFKDRTEGILKEGGVDGEGNFHLERPGGASQNVYLTSTTVDLSKYIGKKVRVWGETFQAQKAGWLMDVGLVEVL